MGQLLLSMIERVNAFAMYVSNVHNQSSIWILDFEFENSIVMTGLFFNFCIKYFPNAFHFTENMQVWKVRIK